MSISYNRFFHLLIDKGITSSELMKQADLSGNIITRMKRNSYISLETIEKICRVLDCGVDDILEFSDDETM